MKKYFFVILSALFLQGCNKEDKTSVKGEIRHEGRVYKLKNAWHHAFEERGVTHDNEPYSSYFHALVFFGNDMGTRVTLPIRSENIEIASGEYHVGLERIRHEYNSIQMEINLADDFVHFATYLNPSKRKMRISYTKKNDDIFAIELKYVDDESDFLVKWEGSVEDRW